MIRYTVTEADYLAALRVLLENKRKALTEKISFFTSTVCLAGLAVWFLIAGNAELWIRVTLTAIALVWAGFAVFRYFFLDTRARLVYKQARARGQLHPDFFKEHKLYVKDGSLHCEYGSLDLTLPLKEITRLSDENGLAMIFKGQNLFDFVPTARLSRGNWDEFLAELQREARAESAAALAAQQKEILPGAVMNRLIPLSREEVAEYLVRMKRRSVLIPACWEAKTIFSLGFPFALLLYCLRVHSWLFAGLCVLILFLFNLGFFLTFLPAYRDVVLPTVEPAPEESYRVIVSDRKIFLYTALHVFVFPVSEMVKTVNAGDCRFFYFKKQKMFFIPEQYADEFDRAVYGRRSVTASAAFKNPADSDEEQ